MSKTDWFEARVEREGVMMSTPGDPLDFVWQDAEQVREIIAKLERALAVLEGTSAEG